MYKVTEKEQALVEYLEVKCEFGFEEYEQFVSELRDCPSHKHAMIHSDACYIEWALETYATDEEMLALDDE